MTENSGKTTADPQAGLRGRSAGETAICSVGKEGMGLSYRGYAIEELAQEASFEEVAYLLLHDKAPNRSELDDFISKLKTLRELPAELKLVLQQIPKDSHPMDVMRTACSLLGNLEPETDFSQQYDKTYRMLSVFPAAICYWYHYAFNGKEINTVTDDDSIAGHFLHCLSGKKPPEQFQRCLSASLILYAEHEFNASTFAARVCAATLSDIFSSVTAAIGTLRGPLHGGANEAAMALIEQFSSAAEAVDAVKAMLQRKEKIMGFGHAVYKISDPRNAIIKSWSKRLADEVDDTVLYPVSEAIEKLMWDEKKLFANADFFSASSYHFMGIPTGLFTPIFVCSRVSGWCAHIFEQRANNRLIRPNADYIGHDERSWPVLDKRE